MIYQAMKSMLKRFFN
ncbi:hypothetical protein [Candidatus Coxiella mudrowiae]|nr:hypothetical protein [Candidatus Coxiella mudrowiae]